MNQIETGKFIAERRKEKSLTQEQLAEKLGVSGKAVSKWETGRGLPEVGLLLPLCRELGVSVNELLSAKAIAADDYVSGAENNMALLVGEKQNGRKRLAFCAVISAVTIVVCLALVLMASFADVPAWLRAAVICAAAAQAASNVAAICVIDAGTGSYVCPKCGKEFVPDLKSYVKAPHTFRRRKLKCPFCGAAEYCERRIR